MAKRTVETHPPTPAPAKGEVLNFDEAVAFLKTSKPTLYRWIGESRLKAFKVGRQWRFYRQDLVKFLEYEEPATAGIDLPAVRQAIQILDERIRRAKKAQAKGGKK